MIIKLGLILKSTNFSFNFHGNIAIVSQLQSLVNLLPHGHETLSKLFVDSKKNRLYLVPNMGSKFEYLYIKQCRINHIRQKRHSHGPRAF